MNTETYRQAKAQDAAQRLEQATKDLAAEERFGGPDDAVSEIEMMDEAAALLSDYDPLARFGGDRAAIRQKLLLSNAITVEMEYRGITDANIDALLEVPVQDMDIDALRAALERIRTA